MSPTPRTLKPTNFRKPKTNEQFAESHASQDIHHEKPQPPAVKKDRRRGLPLICSKEEVTSSSYAIVVGIDPGGLRNDTCEWCPLGDSFWRRE
ncbi:hypothetical protein ACOMHN_008981 [Nucella lapillus]